MVAAPTRVFAMLITTWNVNSVKQRLDPLVAWLSARQPHIVCLQETKCVDEAFPREPLEALGYNVAIHGQKTFNGVAILSKSPFDEVTPRLPGDETDDHARFIEAVVSTRSGVLRIASLYLPNGNPPNTDKYEFKLKWMERLQHYAERRLKLEEPLVLAGFIDAVRAVSDAPGLYSFWDYQAGAWQKNKGLRIDHVLLSPQAADRLVSASIDKHVRGWDKPSDHVPVVVDLDLEAR